MKNKAIKTAVLACVVSSAFGQVFIDDFEQLPLSLDSTATLKLLGAEKTSIYGESREVKLFERSGAVASISVANGLLEFASDGVSSGELHYGITSIGDTRDWSLVRFGSTHVFDIDVASVSAPMKVKFTIYTESGITAGLAGSASLVISEPGTHALTTSMFEGSPNWTDFAGLQITFQPELSGAISVASISSPRLDSIPEPSTYAALSAIALLTFAGWRRFSASQQ